MKLSSIYQFYQQNTKLFEQFTFDFVRFAKQTKRLRKDKHSEESEIYV